MKANKFSLSIITFLITFIFSSSLMATGPRVTPILLESKKNEIFALDFTPFISTDISGGGLVSEIINASFKEVKVDAIITTLPLSEMVKYYLIQENALAVIGDYLNFSSDEKKELISIPIYLLSEKYIYYKPLHKDGIDLKNRDKYIYGAHKGEDIVGFKNIKYIKNISLLKKLKSGRVDFATLPELTANWLINKQFKDEKENFILIDKTPQKLPLFITFNKKNSDGEVIAQKFRDGILKIIESGKYSEIVKRYNVKISKEYLDKLKEYIKGVK